MGVAGEKRAELAVAVLSTAIGDLRLTASALGVRRLEFLGERPASRRPERRCEPVPACRASRRNLDRALKELKEYFSGRRTRFQVPLDLEGTPHQRRVWEALREIPLGETLTYQELARRLGSPAGARAVGRACATNPVPVVVPCHRVVASGGGLQGFGGGLWRKRALLEFEEGQMALQAPSCVQDGEISGRAAGSIRRRIRTSSGAGRWRP